ncbi:acyltransferase family protein [Alistipes sp.]|uniref:acyltransferase family protein n=1 Tax=Alistipes sp. TaxID=1872444 RepID=UPI003AEF3342
MSILHSYISRDESTAVKGVLIFLIVLGHNILFTKYVEPVQGMGYLYCFHIQAFFLLPFLYGSEPLTKKRALCYFIRLYWPFLLLSGLLSIGFYNLYLHNNFNLWALFHTWLTGDVNLIRRYCGIQLLWFLPAMFAMSLFKDLYYHSHPAIRLILLFLSIVANFIIFLAIVDPEYYSLQSKIGSIIPLGMFPGISYLIFGVATRKIIAQIKINRGGGRKGFIFLFSFLICSITYFANTLYWNKGLVLIALKVMMPIIFIILLWYYSKNLSYYRMWKELGERTFLIYLIHPFIGYILYGLVIWRHYPDSLVLAAIAQLIMLIASYYFSTLISCTRRLKNIIQPRSAEGMCSVFRK